ncbi:MAG: peptidoglycan DD-metalloendopeptidase family protein [Spirochaetaceae bacterium]|jgi:murein DD-endopeptidase MepM/ murein hydrolase activator NlpD|nr:peptidoglycan DD-metalloendopeptidase family protein [Spirochaetaceae bacterium]
MLILFKRFAITMRAVKVVMGTAGIILVFFLLVGQGKSVPAPEIISEEGIGGPDRDVPVELVSLETEGLSEPKELNQPKMLLFSSYTVKEGDVPGGVAQQFGLSTSTLMAVNNIKNSRTLQIGKVLRVPNQDGVFYVVKKGDTLSGIATKHKAEIVEIRVANELFSDNINPNTNLFIPGATIAWEEERVVSSSSNGGSVVSNYIMVWPVQGRITSYYGYRRNPISGGRSLHDGLDIAATTGTPIKAAMAGQVISVGYDNVYGNFVLINHSGGYRTLYGHMESFATRGGTYVTTDDIIGYVGSTGQSTGPHLHFTVYKNGSSINPRTVLR